MPSTGSSRTMRSRYPPPPCVEEEPASLARELHGLSNLSEKPGIEGARVRGTVDQYPVIMNMNSSQPEAPPGVNSMPGMGNFSSDDSSGPATPPPRMAEPSLRPRSGSQATSRPWPPPASMSSSSSKPRERPLPPVQSQSARETVTSRPPRPRSLARDDDVPTRGRDRSYSEVYPPQPMREVRMSRQSRPPSVTREENYRGRDRSSVDISQQPMRETRSHRLARPPSPILNHLATSTMSRGRAQPPQVYQETPRELGIPQQARPSSHSPQRGDSIRHEAPVHIIPHSSYGMRSARSRSRGPGYDRTFVETPKSSIGRSNSAKYVTSRPVKSRPRQESPLGYQSDTATARARPAAYAPPPTAPGKAPIGKVANGRTLAERIEEKLRQRQELREAASSSDTETRPRTEKLRPISTILHPSVPTSAPHSPSREANCTMSRRSRESTQASTNPRSSVPTIVPSIAPSLVRSKPKTRGHSRSISSDDARPSRPATSVKFQDQPGQRQSPPKAPATKQTNLSQRPSNPSGLCITLCPRSLPVAGHNDWYTLKGLTHLDICPSCMKQIGHSRFRDLFIPSLAKPPTQKTRCAFSNPWTRLAWTQMIKQQHESLEMLYQMTRPPPGTRLCPGRAASEQTWYRIINADTGSYLPSFHICGSCTRNVRVLMPAHRDTFQHCPEVQERACDLVTSSPRFVKYIDLLDDAASRADSDPSRRPDPREFLAYAKRKVVLRDCLRDRPVLSSWHYMPELPELSVCEDCYDEVVWPLAKMHHPLARSFSTSLRYLPGDGPNRCREASCQLYSGRMRARFREAVVKDDFPGLRDFALRRFEAERRFRDRRDELLVAQGKGYDCDVEMKKAVEEWRRWE
ncbi:uncharacterized protein N7458_012330 [Penicillium daleae]|uniref:Uncharacterized protein n=1 Tax=Penicillium daleae TaxID=63821 RepID=A0AAD6BUQ2_9EURO|nr:uncharacterized protein N7458_012330 [Penicillium daleae]KAJ5433174.1 hypothetical protein N7458_012330 [Penicillium daleae]